MPRVRHASAKDKLSDYDRFFKYLRRSLANSSRNSTQNLSRQVWADSALAESLSTGRQPIRGMLRGSFPFWCGARGALHTHRFMDGCCCVFSLLHLDWRHHTVAILPGPCQRKVIYCDCHRRREPGVPCSASVLTLMQAVHAHRRVFADGRLSLD